MDFTTSSNNLFAALSTDQTSLQTSIASYSLAQAGALLQKQDYTGAIGQLKRALSMDPSSQDAYNNLGNTYLQMSNTKDAISAYKNLIRLNPSSADAYNSLGNAYMQAGDNNNAEKQYKIAARMDRTSTYAPYALGNIYAQSDRLAEAQVQFNNVVKIAPKDAHGYYGLAMVDNKLGNYNDAVTNANKALSLKKDFPEVNFELGTAYHGLGQSDKAQEQVDILNSSTNTSSDPATLASDLSQMLFTPKIISSLPDVSTFNTLNGPSTLLKSLDPAFFFPNTSKDFSVVFQFNADMDPSSIMNVSNWSISKDVLYNNGVNANSNAEISVASTPKRVIYDPSSMQATLTFTISQNAFATGKMDPSHLVFQFSGVDANGNKMDPTADQVSGASALAY